MIILSKQILYFHYSFNILKNNLLVNFMFLLLSKLPNIDQNIDPVHFFNLLVLHRFLHINSLILKFVLFNLVLILKIVLFNKLGLKLYFFNPPVHHRFLHIDSLILKFVLFNLVLILKIVLFNKLGLHKFTIQFTISITPKHLNKSFIIRFPKD